MSGPARVSPWLVAVLRPIHWFLIRCYFRVSVRHREKLPVGVPMILAPTHRSKWDSLMLTHLTGRPLYYLASRNNFNGFQGWVMRRMGCIPINVDHHVISTFVFTEFLRVE